jgi:putative membrane protein
LREGLFATARIIRLRLEMDTMFPVFSTLYREEALIIALPLAFVSSPLIRGPVARVARSGDVNPLCLFYAGSGQSRGRVAGGCRVSNPSHTDRTSADTGSRGAGAIAGRFEVRVTADTHFGWLRTRASLERTLLSWIRTAVSLIGFGFTIVQFFQRVQELPGVNPTYHPDAPWYLGLALIFCGVLALFVSVWQYHWTVNYLWSGDFAPVAGITKEGIQTPIIAVAVLLMFIGTFAFVAVLLHFV